MKEAITLRYMPVDNQYVVTKLKNRMTPTVNSYLKSKDVEALLMEAKLSRGKLEVNIVQ
jgi:hypothetical protein